MPGVILIHGGIDTSVGELEGNERVLPVINRIGKDVKAEVDLKLVGAAKGQVVHFRDLWKKEDVGEFKDTFALSDISSPRTFSSIEPPPAGTFKITGWWWPLVQFVRWKNTMTDDDLAWLMMKVGFPFIILIVASALYSLFTIVEHSPEKPKKD
ncbi:hypothetical protein HDU67_002097 [Dinochytrium kinnereticum]|nr:hypothetical protein HDU67_002097 [Dinochytrium kinnereticum]